MDVGAGQCEFINNIHSNNKIAVDVNKDIKHVAGKDVHVIIASVKNLQKIFKKESVDVLFMSNLLEHLDDKEDVFRLLNEAYKILRKKGRLLVMQPDIKLIGGEYWDFFDHKVPITLASLSEVLLAIGYTITFCKYPFLPYTTKTRFLPFWPPLLRIYLRLRILHYLFGKQFFLCAEKE